MHNIKQSDLPSNRAFGFLFSFLSIALFCYSYGFKQEIILLYASIIAATFFTFFTIFAPNFLSPLNRAWFKVGHFMGKLVSPIFLVFIFFILITPVACITRIFGRDQLLLIKNTEISSYWVKKSSVDSSLTSFKDQY